MSLFGRKAYIVQFDSMSGVFDAGDVIVEKTPGDVTALNIGKLIKSIKQYRSEKRAEREELAEQQRLERERIAEQARADREEVERLKEELRRLKERPDREGGPNDSEQ